MKRFVLSLSVAYILAALASFVAFAMPNGNGNGGYICVLFCILAIGFLVIYERLEVEEKEK